MTSVPLLFDCVVISVAVVMPLKQATRDKIAVRNGTEFFPGNFTCPPPARWWCETLPVTDVRYPSEQVVPLLAGPRAFAGPTGASPRL